MSDHVNSDVGTETESAYYYPQPYWTDQEGAGLKTLLLFFDEISILLPRYMAGRQEVADPTLAGPLTDLGLLRVLQPESFIDQQMAEDLTTIMVDLLTSDVFADLERYPAGYQELSRSRVGWGVDIGLARMLIEELQARELAHPTEDGVSVPLHPVVRTTILVILAQLARAAGRRQGLSLHPVTADAMRMQDLMETLGRSRLPSAGHLVAFDIEPVAISLATVPLDIELGPLAPDDRHAILQIRREELQDRAHALRRLAQRTWALPQMAGFGLGLAGAAWELAGQNDPVSAAIITAASATALIAGTTTGTADAYSYIHRIERTFAGR